MEIDHLFNWQPYLIAIIIGLLIGIEREKAHPNVKAMGIRTFLLISLLGAIAGGLESILISGLLSAFTLIVILISYYTQTNSNHPNVDRGLTTEFAAVIVFCLGLLAHSSPTLASVIGPVVAVILFSKSSLHRFTHAIKPTEFQAALLLLLAGVVIINLVPDGAIDPWGIFNPKQFGYLILTLATLEFASYLTMKIIGEKQGPLIFGFLGGFVSSTAVILSAARQSKQVPTTWRSQLIAAMAGQLAALVELLIIVGIIAPIILKSLLIPVGASLGAVAISIFILFRKNDTGSTHPKLKSPLDWKAVLRMALTLATFLAVISLAKKWLGDQATWAMSFVAGLFELHGVSLANATLFSQEKLSAEITFQNILLAIIASLIAKISISFALARMGRFTQILLLITVPLIAALAAFLIFVSF